ncbi:DUF1090 domain-containing protein [Enterobacter sp. RIT418]|uniref:DUF1090 domain-containing protein n=1 Tax=Enterobacter sp. RIT418 TaxID=2202164 RepID=UPI000D4BC565|nr:DUF1090 domain-containing protein [Enterobacter sp. RIT 418]RAU36931.1 DUF1090 domain-containing protein [Enterobacter sp. RIT 418]
MKKLTMLCALSLMATSFATIASDSLTGCAAKKQSVQQQIDQAKKYGNTHRVAGLEKAYSEIAENCTDASLEKARVAKVSEKEQKVAEREQELREAKALGRSDKIAKKEKKLNEAREELREAQAELAK